MFTIISILLTLVVLFGASAVIGRQGNRRKAERRADANGDQEIAQALRKADSDITFGRIYPHYPRRQYLRIVFAARPFG